MVRLTQSRPDVFIFDSVFAPRRSSGSLQLSDPLLNALLLAADLLHQRRLTRDALLLLILYSICKETYITTLLINITLPSRDWENEHLKRLNHCFEALDTSLPAGQKYVNATKAQTKHA